jgi:hypothetical protein
MPENKNQKQGLSKVGLFLINEGLVKEEDMAKALEIQKQETEEAKTPLEKILVRKGLLSGKQMEGLFSHPEIREKTGAMAVEAGLISEQQLSDCLSMKNPGEQIDQVLLREGHLTSDTLRELMENRVDGMKLGELAIKLDMINQKDLEDAIKIKSSQRSIGQILCDMGTITATELNQVFLKMYSHKMRLGEILIKQGIINSDMLQEALEEQLQKEAVLGAILIKKNLITTEQLYSALAIQYDIPFLKSKDLAGTVAQKSLLCNILDRKQAEKNRILPLLLKEKTLTLAVFNPESKRHVNGLKEKHADLQINCALITEEKFNEIFEILYGVKFTSCKDTANEEAKDEDLEFMDDKFEEEVTRFPDGEMRSAIPPADNHRAAFRDSPPVNGKIVLSDPRNEGILIDRLYERYETLKEKKGLAASRSDFPLFKEFIVNNYNTICDTFECRAVAFCIDAGEDRLKILAEPRN